MNRRSHKSFMAACLLAGVFALGACTSTPPPARDAAIIPLPGSLRQDSTVFVLKRNATIGITDAQLEPAARYLGDLLGISHIRQGEGTITLALGEAGGKAGGYTLSVDPEKVAITGNTYGGVVAGISSLRQLFPPQAEVQKTGTEWAIPSVSITDAPRYEWRGIMLDVSRHFYTTTEVKELLDLMALYKMNKLHWHLTDDQGWRIEIKKYPLLTEKGAWRKLNSHDRECLRMAKEDDNPDFLLPEDKMRVVEGDTLYGGFYTQEDIRDVVAYAGVRGIDIVPEIDMPGHMLAAVSNYEGVSCFAETGWGSTFSSPVCPGKDSALEFCKNVYSELIALFPYKYVHIGGDEVEKTNWKKCPDCQQRMRANGLKTEEELQSWFIHEMEHFFNEQGKEMIGWDEIIEGGLSKTATVMWWRSWAKDAPGKTTTQGNHIIFTPNSCFYLDYQQDKNSVPGIYNFDPNNEVKDADRQALVLGVQGNVWTEWIPSRERLQYMVFPRLQAIAELGWSDPAQKDWHGFAQRLSAHFERLNLLNVNYRIPDLEGFYKTNAFIGEGQVIATCLDSTATVRYTLDGSVPTTQSPRYEGSLSISETTDITFRTFRPNGKPCDISTTRYVKSEYAPAVTVAPSNPGLKATWYAFTGNRCADIESAPRNGVYPVEDVKIPKQVKGNIGLVINGYINVPQDGIYTFALLSDDGSTLVIDKELVIDNDKPHGPREVIGQKALAQGYHPITVRYFDQNGGTLKLTVTGADGKEIPFTYLYAY